MGLQEILVLRDSDLLVHQIQGEWETRDLKLIPYRQCLHNLCQRFSSVEFRHIPKVYNEIDDALATLASMLHHPDKTYVDPLHIQVRDQHAYCNVVEEELDGEPWFHDIKEYIKSGVYPVHATCHQKRSLRRLASGFFLSGGILYKRTPGLGLLRCVDAKEASTIMTEVHSRVCRLHMNGYVLAKKILRVHSDLIHSPPSELHTMSAPWPFVAWSMDVIGPIKPVASNGHKFILVSIDYFTKWVEAVTFKPVTKKNPKVIIIDNAANLTSHLMKEKRMTRAYNKKVCPRKFEVGQLVLKRILPHQTEDKGKFAPNWQRPFIVKRVLPNGALYLADIEGRCVDIAINSDAVKRYYLVFVKQARKDFKAYYQLFNCTKQSSAKHIASDRIQKEQCDDN
ncbi:uncharacterized protein [Nicotiana tomentosiformis]|uniref:uncharacterized protein n=1 Tax=Nicotiana tomentosiformis TaxID=4098 RepID=UPI00388CECAE